MNIIRKSLKVYILCIMLFAMLTLVLAAVICFTPFKEGWSFAGLTAIMSAVSFFLGLTEGRVVGRKGLIVGAASSFVFLFIILIMADEAFDVGFNAAGLRIFHVIPIFSGAIGGIFGANNS